jgi:hypothetical protein
MNVTFCHLFTYILSAIMLSVIMLSVIMLSVIMLSVIVLSVEAPRRECDEQNTLEAA